MKSKLKDTVLKTILASVALLVFSSCNQFHNANDWPMKKGAYPGYVPREVSSNAR